VAKSVIIQHLEYSLQRSDHLTHTLMLLLFILHGVLLANSLTLTLMLLSVRVLACMRSP
jgi:hypothetical protein